MGNLELARWYAALLGIALIVFGLAGFVDNPIVSGPAAEPLFVTGPAHDLVHVATGTVALFIAFGLPGSGLVKGLLGFGGFYLLFLLLTLASPTLLGLSGTELSLASHVLHAALATMSLLIGWLARPPTVLRAAEG